MVPANLIKCSQQELLNLVLHLLDLASDWALSGVENGDGDDVTGHAACSSEVRLLAYVNVRDVFVLAQEWQVKDDLKRLGVGGKHDEIRNTSVESLGGLVGALLEELEVLGLVEEVEDVLAHLVVSLWPGSALLFGILYITIN